MDQMFLNVRVCFLALFCSVLATPIALAQVNECHPYKLRNGDNVTLHKRSFVDEVICPKDSPTCPNRPFKIKRFKNLNQPDNAVGPPKKFGRPGTKAYSLGCNGYAIWKFTDNVIVDVEGPDILVFETGRAKEPTTVEISRDGANWRIVGVVKGGKTSIDISEHVKPGEKLRYIRLTDLGSSKCNEYAGADITAIATYVFSEIKTEDESSGIIFDVGQSILQPHGKRLIDRIFAGSSIENSRLEIEGHTDSDGRTNDNQVLSVDRAKAVKKYIKTKDFLKGEHIRTFGAGELRPVDTNATEKGRAKNRRVELTFIPLSPCR